MHRRIRACSLFALAVMAVAMPAGRSGAATAAGTAAAAGPNDWPQFGGAANHPGLYAGQSSISTATVAGLALEFADDMGPHTASESSPVVSNGVVYIGGFDGRLTAFALNGCAGRRCQPLWSGKTKNDITGSPAVAGDTVFVGSADHNLYAFPADGCGAATCAALWRGHLTGAVVGSSVAVAEHRVFVGTYDGGIAAFSADGCGGPRCEPLWLGHSPGTITSSPAVAGGNVYITATSGTNLGGRLLVFDAAGCGQPRCDPLWMADLNGTPFENSVSVVGGKVFATSSDSQLHVFDANGCGGATCTELWRGNQAEIAAATVAVADGIVFVAGQPFVGIGIGTVLAYDVDGCGSATCDPLWIGFNHSNGFESSPVVVNDTVLVAKGPSGVGFVDVGVFAFPTAGCGEALCEPTAFIPTSNNQNYLGSSLAVAGDRVLFAADNNDAETTFLYSISLPAAG